tara:strand:- start:356 stop:577 length:222 start_codon:yes stop_codon:yes gene_type:complete
MRDYYRWLGRTMMVFAVLVAVGWTLMVLTLAGAPEVDHPPTMANTLPLLLGVYALSAVAFLIGRVLAGIPSGE